MRTISISTDVFAAVWAERQDGEDNEDSVLRRILIGKKNIVENPNPSPTLRGIEIDEYHLSLPYDFEIFRTYKGKKFTAYARGGRWFLESDGKSYPSLHKLSWSIVGGRENAWKNWRFRNACGVVQKLSVLRSEELVRRKSTTETTKTAEELGL